MELKKLKKSLLPYLIFVVIVGTFFLVLELYLAIELQNETVVCEGTFQDKVLPKEICPIGAYCKKVNGDKVGVCTPYIEYFDINKSDKFNRMKELWR